MLQQKSRKVRLSIYCRTHEPSTNILLTRHVTFAIAGGSNATQKSPDAPIVYCITHPVHLGPHAAKRALGVRTRAKTLEFCDCKYSVSNQVLTRLYGGSTSFKPLPRYWIRLQRIYLCQPTLSVSLKMRSTWSIKDFLMHAWNCHRFGKSYL